MSSAPTQLAVAPSASSLVTSTSQIQKDYLEEPPACSNNLGPRVRGGGVKGKHLIRSHAMRESASPPRTPTPRSEGLAASPVSGGLHSSNETINDQKVQVQSSSPLLSSSNSPSQEAPPSVIVTSQHPQQQQQHHQIRSAAAATTTIMYSCNENNGVVCNQSQLDVDFPKLTPPKSSKGHRNHSNNSNRESIEKQLNVSDSSSSSSSSANNKQTTNFNSTGMCTNGIDPNNVNGKGSHHKNGENDNKMNYHHNNNNNHSHHQNNNNMQSPPMSQQRRNQSTLSPQEHHQQQQQQQQHHHHHDPIQNDSAIICSLTNLQISSPPHLCFDEDNRCQRNDDGGGQQNCNNSCNAYQHDDNRNNMCESPTDSTSKYDRMGKKHRSSANAKSSKPRLKNMGSSSSVEGGNSTSGFISRDSSTEQFTDQSGVDLREFFKDTLSKNPKDRSMLLRIEKDLTELAHDKTRSDILYPAMSSYNRMLIHRVAAFFGMEHNVDSTTPQCVIVAKTKATRIPTIKFKSLYRVTDIPPRKSILKRDAHSFDESRHGHGLLNCPDRGMLDRKAKSYEQREEEYEQVRKRIFRVRDGGDMNEWPHWCSIDSPEHSNRLRHNKLKVQSLSMDSRSDGRPSVSKSHSFGGYGGQPPNSGPLTRGDSINSTRSAGPRLFPKQDSIGSTNTAWGLSPSSSGSIYHFDPSNLPPSQAVASGMYSKSPGVASVHRKVIDKQKVIKSEEQNSTVNNNNNNTNHNNINNSSNNTQDSVIVVSGNVSMNGSGSSDTTIVATTVAADCLPTNNITNSIENLSESSAQTVLIVDNANHDEGDDETNLTKDNHTHREMSDIQEESSSQSNEDKLVSTIDCLTDTQDQPKLKNQATSPNIPSPEPDQNVQLNEIARTSSSSTESNPSQSSINSTSTTTSTNIQYVKKDDSISSKQSTPNIPLMSFAPAGYQAVDGSTVFTPPSNGPFPTTAYQHGPDGSVYAVPQPMVYAYPPPMDGDFQGYFMPVYDQAVAQRDPNGLVPAAAQAIYQQAGGPTTVVPVAYPAASYGGSSLYQGQVVYSPEQFATTGTTGQLQQYPMTTYPVGYPYPYNGYWGQPMTYYVPQPQLGNAVPSSLIPQPLAGTGSAASLGNSAHNNSNATKRNTPPQHALSSGHNSQSATPASTYQFAPGVPLALATDPNGPTMYAIPQSTVFPNMLSYAPPSTSSAAAGVLSHLSHPQHNAVINPLISTHPSGHNGPSIPLDTSCGGYALNNGTHANNSGTPHSAPSTPLSNPLPLPHQQRNPPLFATPPIIPNNYNNPMHNHYHHFSDVQNGGINSYATYERRNSNNKRNSGYVQNSRQTSYTNINQNSRKPNIGEITNNSSSPSAIQNSRSSTHLTQQKRMNSSSDNKTQSSSGGAMNNNHSSASTNNAQNISSNSNTDNKIRNTIVGANGVGGGGGAIISGIRSKPSNLDLRRSASQRNSPSTNSIESNNNSPNSIASNHMTGNHLSSIDHPPPMYMTRGTHIPPMHPPTASAFVAAAAAVANDAAAQQLIGAYNHPAPTGMYIKYGQTYFAHPTMALPNNRRSPPNDLRPPLPPLTGVFPTVNMMLPARHMQPRHPNPNYKGNKPSR